MIFIDNKKLILTFVQPSIKVHSVGNGVALELIMSQLLSKLQHEATDDLFIWIKSESTCDYNIHRLHSEKIKSIKLMVS